MLLGDRRKENGKSAAELTLVKLARFPWEIGPLGPYTPDEAWNISCLRSVAGVLCWMIVF